MKTLVAALLAIASTFAQAGPIAGQGTWETTLQARDIYGNAVSLQDTRAAFFYDTTLNVTWLADLNVNGLMDWTTAVTWADSLDVGGFDDWRLPRVIDSAAPGCQYSSSGGTDCGYNVQTEVDGAYNEWAHLYYITLGDIAACSPDGTPETCDDAQSGWGPTNTAYFRNLAADCCNYWSSTGYAPDARFAWYFGPRDGNQGYLTTWRSSYAVAVRSGDVLRDGGTVPEPPSWLLSLLALGCVRASVHRTSRRGDSD